MRDIVSKAPFGDIASEEIEQALGRIFAQDGFVKSPALASFLKFVVDETLAGRGDRLKAFAIATQALQRRTDFDPQTQSIVRVQAKRLRESLDAYYAGPGASDPIVIALPLGAYRPTIERRRGGGSPSTANPPPAEAAPLTPQRLWLLVGLSQGNNILVAAVVAAAILFWLGVGGFRGGGGADAPIEAPPELTVAFAGSEADPAGLPARIQTRIESGLANFDYFRVVLAGATPGSAATPDYALTGAATPLGGGQEIEMRLKRVATGELIWSRRWPEIDASDAQALDSLARTIVIAVGDIGGGALFADIRARIARAKASQTGYGCVIAAEEFIRDRNYAEERATLNCLDAEISTHPQNVMALTTLSSILLAEYINALPESRGVADLQRALQLARRAYDLAPQRPSSQAALFGARFYDKRFDDAFELAREALAQGPQSSLLTGRIARAYISRGAYDEGVAQLQKSPAGMPAASAALLTLVALMRADREGAYDYARRQQTAATPLGLVTRILAFHEHGDEAGAAEAMRTLNADFPGFARGIPAALDRHALTDAIQRRLLDGLAAAGFAPPKP